MGKTVDIKPRGVKIELDRERHLCFKFSGMAWLIEKYGDLDKVFSALTSLDGRGISADTLRIFSDFIYAGLMHEDKDLTPEAVFDLLDLGSMNMLSDAIKTALGMSMPEPKGGKENPPA